MSLPGFDPRATADEVLGERRLDGLSVLITGATAGLGLETAAALAGHGARVLIGSRDAARGEQACASIRARHPDAAVEVVPLDLASLASVRRCAAALPVSRLDALICNAGVYGGGGHTTEDGFEATIGICHIGHFALFQGVRERLRASGKARVVVVASQSHRSPARLDLDALPGPRTYPRTPLGTRLHDHHAYGQAKLCNILFAVELDRRCASEGIRANALHPGTLVSTSIGRDSVLARIALAAARPFAKTPAQAAATSVWLASAPELADVGGQYFRDGRPVPASREAQRPELARLLWERTERWIADAQG